MLHETEATEICVRTWQLIQLSLKRRNAKGTLRLPAT